jgi:acetyltransferase-like isoleucine patch superfamily enzyme
MKFLKRVFFYINNYSKFKYLNFNSYIDSPLKIEGKENIFINKNVIVKYKSWLAALPYSNSGCILEIGSGSVIGNFNHIYATNSIVIGKNVLTADKVYISDNQHVYEDINIPIINQPIKQLRTVHIGDGSWLGENVCVIGASIGKNCVIGANSVVTKDISDYSVAVGSPARVIKKYNFKLAIWEKVL